MTDIRGNENSLVGARGPVWQDELLTRLRSDSRFAQQLKGVIAWDAIPVGQLTSSRTLKDSAQASLSYFSSSSTGEPKQISFSCQDWQETVAHRAECLAELGLGGNHLAAIVLPFGPWFSGDNLSESLMHLGAGVLPAGMYGPHLAGSIRLMSKVGVNALITTPSIARNLVRFPFPPIIDKLVLVGEAVSASIREQLAAHFGTAPRCLFAASEAILGSEIDGEPGVFHWNPNRLHLEVITQNGGISDTGKGELLVTRRYGDVTPLLRYPLNDLVELLSCESKKPRFRYLGRDGHSFGLATGVKVGRAQLDRFLDQVDRPVHEAHFAVEHTPEGDQITIVLGCSAQLPDPGYVRSRFLTSSLDVSDAYRSGFINVEVKTHIVPVRAKRHLRVTERPWCL